MAPGTEHGACTAHTVPAMATLVSTLTLLCTRRSPALPDQPAPSKLAMA